MNTLSIIPLLFGTIFLGNGLISKQFPPENINSLYGYRTNSSMKNSDTWKMANDYSSGLMIKCGATMLLFGVISLLLPDIGKAGPLIGLTLFIATIIILPYKTETHLKKHFDNEGNRKDI